MSTLPQPHLPRSSHTTALHPVGARRPQLRTAAVTAGGLACAAFLLTVSPVSAATATAAPATSADCAAAEAALEADFGELRLDGVTSGMVAGWLQRLESGSPGLHETERAVLAAQVEADWARELFGYRIEDTLQAADAEQAARAELTAAQQADPVDPDRVAAAGTALAEAEEALATAQQAEEDAEVVLHTAETELLQRQDDFARATARLDALIAEVERTTGDGEGDWQGLHDRLAAVEAECQGGSATPPPTAAPEPGGQPLPGQAPVARPVTGTATFAG